MPLFCLESLIEVFAHVGNRASQRGLCIQQAQRIRFSPSRYSPDFTHALNTNCYRRVGSAEEQKPP